jgi:hypothetical protein
VVSQKPADANGPQEDVEAPNWDGPERRGTPDRRRGNRRIDERRTAGIGEIMDDRREQRGRRNNARRGEPKRRDRNT